MNLLLYQRPLLSHEIAEHVLNVSMLLKQFAGDDVPALMLQKFHGNDDELFDRYYKIITIKKTRSLKYRKIYFIN